MSFRVKTNVLIILAILFAVFLVARIGLLNKINSNVSDMPKGCRLWDGNYCSLSYYELIAKSDQMDGIYVEVIGYLGIDQFKLVIYPSKMAYDIDDQVSSIEINGDSRLLDEINKSKTFNYILAFGKFSLYDGQRNVGQNGRLGMLRISAPPIPVGRRVMDRSSTTLGFNALDEVGADDSESDRPRRQKSGSRKSGSN